MLFINSFVLLNTAGEAPAAKRQFYKLIVSFVAHDDIVMNLYHSTQFLSLCTAHISNNVYSD
jgi:hypothetical protein